MTTFHSNALRALVPAIALAFSQGAFATPQLPEFNYQGRLEQNGYAANGSYAMTFSLWDAPTGGNQIGSTISEASWPVVNGVFSINLAFAGAFEGQQSTLSTALPRPLHPVNLAGYSGAVALISPQGYIMQIDAGGTIGGSGTATYASNDCSGPALIVASTINPGGVVSLGTQNKLYYVPRTGATVLTDPMPQSRSSSALGTCGPYTTQIFGQVYSAPPNVPATTGIDPVVEPVTVTIDYVP